MSHMSRSYKAAYLYQFKETPAELVARRILLTKLRDLEMKQAKMTL